MSDLARYLVSERVVLGFSGSSREAILRELAHRLGGSDDAAREAVYDDLLAREQMSTTGIGSGVAFPHARVDFLPGVRLAFVRTANPVDFRALDGRPVDLFVAIAGPKSDRRVFLSVLGSLSYVFRTASVRAEFRAAAGPAEVLELLRREVPTGTSADSSGD
jgi:PTS system nitrogen regulatory IIA component